MKLITWNVNGLRACVGKGFGDVFRSLDADFFCLQETKMQEGQLDLQFEGYKSYWNYADKKGYSGTAVFTRLEPLSVRYGIGIDEHDHEGRVITLEMNDFYLVCVFRILRRNFAAWITECVGMMISALICADSRRRRGSLSVAT